MSKNHNNYNNYNNYNNKHRHETSPAVKAVSEPVEEALEVVETKIVSEPVLEEPEEIAKVVEEPTQVGVVVNVDKLRVRKEPSAEAQVICTIDRGTALVIDVNKSTNDFYSVCTETGVNGYCMKKFINIK